ncbi:MAG: hydroxymethylbilane synthase [bacterium]|nr:hydroxymethylbilane synthase [bacterium]
MTKLIAGTRGSNLARTQTQTVIDLLRKTSPKLEIETRIVKTKGDHIQDTPLIQIGGKGLFTKELEVSLAKREIDFAVHSLKDLPVELPPGLTLGAYLTRDLPNDVLVSKGNLALDDIPHQGTIATGSLRRKFQLLRYRSDLQIVDIRGNIETRLQKLKNNNWDGLILAHAALKRLEKTEIISDLISQEIMYPAVAQGIVAVECRDETAMHDIFRPINHGNTAIYAIAERAFLQDIGGGCQVPLGVISDIQGEQLTLSGIYMPQEDNIIQERVVGDARSPEQTGRELAEKILMRVSTS